MIPAPKMIKTDGEDLPSRRKVVNFAESDGRQGDDGHVQRIEKRPALDKGVAERADNEDGVKMLREKRKRRTGSIAAPSEIARS